MSTMEASRGIFVRDLSLKLQSISLLFSSFPDRTHQTLPFLKLLIMTWIQDFDWSIDVIAELNWMELAPFRAGGIVAWWIPTQSDSRGCLGSFSSAVSVDLSKDQSQNLAVKNAEI